MKVVITEQGNIFRKQNLIPFYLTNIRSKSCPKHKNNIYDTSYKNMNANRDFLENKPREIRIKLPNIHLSKEFREKIRKNNQSKLHNCSISQDFTDRNLSFYDNSKYADTERAIKMQNIHNNNSGLTDSLIQNIKKKKIILKRNQKIESCSLNNSREKFKNPALLEKHYFNLTQREELFKKIHKTQQRNLGILLEKMHPKITKFSWELLDNLVQKERLRKQIMLEKRHKKLFSDNWTGKRIVRMSEPRKITGKYMNISKCYSQILY